MIARDIGLDPNICGDTPGFTFHGQSLTTAQVALDVGRTGAQYLLTGPDQRNFDMALIKRTGLGEASIPFRLELFNLFNHPSFANPASDVSSPSAFEKKSAL